MARFTSNARFLQKIDTSLGLIVCLLLTCARRVGDFFAVKKKAAKPKKILFIKLAEQGSTVLANDAISRAVKICGARNVYFLLFEENRFILDALGLVPHENVLTIRTSSPLSIATSCFARLLEIRRLRIDACIDMEFFARFTAALTWLTGASTRVGFHGYFGSGPYRGDLMTHRVLYSAHLHTSSVFSSLVMALENNSKNFPTFPIIPPPGTEPPRFQASTDEKNKIATMLSKLMSERKDRLILLNANASDLLPLRKWDEKNYQELARRLLAEYDDVSIAFTGMPEEAGKIASLVDVLQSPRVFCLAGHTTLRELLIVYNQADILVTNDSGPAHFAALTSIDVITLFGPETPLLFGAPTPRNHSIWLGLACSPCVNAFNNRQTSCHDNLCMKMISVDQVFEKVCNVLCQRKSR